MKKVLLLVAAALLLSSAVAQTVLKYLPADSVLVFGVHDLKSHEGKLQPFIDEYNRLGLNDSITKLADNQDGDSESNDLKGFKKSNPLKNMEAMDILGKEAWIAVSASKFNPIPAVSGFFVLSPKALKPFKAELEKQSAAEGVEKMTEGKYSFYLEPVEEEDSPIEAIAYTVVDDLVVISSSADSMRAILRQIGGSNDPNFISSEGYGKTLGRLGQGNLYTFIDYGGIADLIKPFGNGLGFDELIDRLVKAFNTVGVTATVGKITNDGIEYNSLQALNQSAGDQELYALLSSNAAANHDVKFPEGAVNVSSSRIDLKAWWSYLNGLALSVPDLGMSLDDMATMFLQVDLNESFFSWVGDQVMTITTGNAQVSQPGVPSSNLLGEVVYVLSTNNPQAAQDGLTTLITSLSKGASAFGDPDGGSGASMEPSTEVVNGITMTSYEVSNGVIANYAVSNGFVYLGTTKEALAKVLSAAPANNPMMQLVPADARSFSVSNSKEAMHGLAEQIGSQIGMVAGLSGASNLDFEAVDESSSKMTEFINFIADRLNYSVAYTQVKDGNVSGYGKMDVAW